jgi:hypothetical protein
MLSSQEGVRCFSIGLECFDQELLTMGASSYEREEFSKCSVPVNMSAWRSVCILILRLDFGVNKPKDPVATDLHRQCFPII